MDEDHGRSSATRHYMATQKTKRWENREDSLSNIFLKLLRFWDVQYCLTFKKVFVKQHQGNDRELLRKPVSDGPSLVWKACGEFWIMWPAERKRSELLNAWPTYTSEHRSLLKESYWLFLLQNIINQYRDNDFKLYQ